MPAHITIIHTRIGLPSLHIVGDLTFDLLNERGEPITPLRVTRTSPPQGEPTLGDIFELLCKVRDTTMATDTNLDAIAKDWPQVKAALAALQTALQTRITQDSNTIATLTAELAASATGNAPPISDSRAAQIDTDMQAALQSIQATTASLGTVTVPASTAQTVAAAAGPTATATGATGASTGAVGGSTGSTGTAAGATASTGATGVAAPAPNPSIGATGATGGSLPPGTPPAGAI